MKKSLLFLSLAAVVTFSTNVQAQIRNGQWGGQVVVRSNGMLADWGLQILDPLARIAPRSIAPWVSIRSVEHDYRYSPLWRAFFPYSWTQTIEETGANERIKTVNPRWWKSFLWPDFDRDYHLAVGYSIGYRWYNFPLAFSVGCRYEWMGLRVPSGVMEGMHHIQNIVPTVGVSWRVLGKDGLAGIAEKNGWGDEQEPSDLGEAVVEVTKQTVGGLFALDANINVKVFGDVSYVKNMGYDNPKGLDGNVINDGLRFAIGIGWELLSDADPISYEVRYEWDGYDLFNVPGVQTHTGRFVGMLGIRF